jgi:transcriptional regulator with XRE-family HTH domain
MSLYKYGRTISEFTKRYREEAGLTQVELAKLLKLRTGQYVSNVERGLNTCPESFCRRFAKILPRERAIWLTDILIEQKAQEITSKFKIKNASGDRR